MNKVSLKMLSIVLVGGVAIAMFLPSLMDARDKSRDKSAVTDIRTLGTALMVCLSDEASCPQAAAFRSRLRPDEGCKDLTPKEAAQLVVKGSDLKPPAAVDPWGRPYELCVERGSETNVMVLRSAGPNGRFESPSGAEITSPSAGSAPVDLDSDDLVWADGYFVSWPKS